LANCPELVQPADPTALFAGLIEKKPEEAGGLLGLRIELETGYRHPWGRRGFLGKVGGGKAAKISVIRDLFTS